MALMSIGIIGLGKMGTGIAERLLKAGYTVFGYDPSQEAKKEAALLGVTIVDALSECGRYVEVIWLMIPAGTLVDTVLTTILPTLQKDTIIIDGGNSLYTDSVRRAEQLSKQNMHFLDCGTSGGIHGVEHGFCLMVGGAVNAYTKALPFLKAIASVDGVAHVGKSGAGHYVKMVHNGIEYGLLQAYAEGFHLVKEGSYKDLDMHQIATLWNTSSIIRSFILTLATNIFAHDQELKNVVGTIAESGMGKWTVDNAHKENIPLNVIETALNIRAESRKMGGNYATKVVALLREQFGGHAVERESYEEQK
jgi:6-phosphogluconate dehydrogenase